MKRFSVMITGGAVIAGGIGACLIGIVLGKPNEVLSTYTAVGAGIGLVGSLILQAIKPLK